MDLKELMGEDLYNQMIAKLGDKHKVAIVSDGKWFPKEKFDEVNTAKKNAESTLAERDTQLEQLKASVGDNAALQTQIQELQTANQETKTRYETELKDLRLTTAIKLALGDDVHDADYAVGQLDKTLISIDENGAIKSGLTEQIDSLRTNKAFLFKPKDEGAPAPSYRGAKPGEAGAGGGKPPADPTGYNAGKAIAEARNQQKQGSVTK